MKRNNKKRKKLSKEVFRKGILSFCVTTLALIFVAGSAVSIYNTASVIYGENEVASVQKNQTSYEFTLFSQTKTLPSEELEKWIDSLAGYSPWLPDEFRIFLLAVEGINQAAETVVAFWTNR